MIMSQTWDMEDQGKRLFLFPMRCGVWGVEGGVKFLWNEMCEQKKEFDFSFLIVFGLYDLVDVCICMYIKRAR